jgi:putative oxidoreductase
MEKMLILIGRIFFSMIFVMAGYSHVMSNQLIAYAASAGVPSPALMVPAAGLLAFFGGLSVLLGYKAKWGAWFIVLFLVPVTLVMHSFWGATDTQVAMMQMTMFQKNLSMLGGALLIAHYGSGPYSLDTYISSFGKRKS